MRSASSGRILAAVALLGSLALLAPLLLGATFIGVDMRAHDQRIDGLEARVRHHAEVELGLDCEGPGIRNVGTYLGGGGSECDVWIELRCAGSLDGGDFHLPGPSGDLVQVRRDGAGVFWLVSDIDSLEPGMDPRCW